MRYSVIIKTIDHEKDHPFIFQIEAEEFFNLSVKDLLQNPTDFFTIFIIDNFTNTIINSYDSYVSALPVEYFEVKITSTSVKEMIDNLHDLMELRGITLSKLSIQSGINLGNLNRFFKAEKNPTLRTYVRISNSINLL